MPAGFTVTQELITGAGAVSPDTEESGVSLSSHLPAKPWGSWLALSGKLGDLSNAAALFPKETFPGSCPSLLPSG